jgi:hypothetical protein
MQLFNLQLHAINCYLQLCFVIFTISHQHLQSIIVIVTMVQLIVITKCYPSMLTRFLDFSFKKRPLYQINYKKNHNLLTSMYCTYTFDAHYNIFGYIKVYL